MAKDVFDELFGRNQKLLDELYDWAKTENNKDALAMLDGALFGLRSIIYSRQRELGRRSSDYGRQ